MGVMGPGNRLRQNPFWVETFDPKPNAKNPKLKFRHKNAKTCLIRYIYAGFVQVLCILGSDGFRWVLGMPRMGYKMGSAEVYQEMGPKFS